MGKSSIWQRVSRRRPCPVCMKPDWCLYTGDTSNPDAVICARIESGRRCGDAGWLHLLRRDGPTWSPRLRRIESSAQRIVKPVLDFNRLALDCVAALQPEDLDKLAVALGVSAESLRRLGVGWSVKHGAWTFPMRNASGKVLGIRLRLPNGKKLSVRGGKQGLFIPRPHPNPLTNGEETKLTTNHSPLTTLLICEGPTDTAAVLDFGFYAVGRPSCTGGIALLIELVRTNKPLGVVIVADNDRPGLHGAMLLQATLLPYCKYGVKLIQPPPGVKDARDWKQRGATAAEVQAAIDAAVVRKLSIESMIRGKRFESWKIVS